MDQQHLDSQVEFETLRVVLGGKKSRKEHAADGIAQHISQRQSVLFLAIKCSCARHLAWPSVSWARVGPTKADGHTRRACPGSLSAPAAAAAAPDDDEAAPLASGVVPLLSGEREEPVAHLARTSSVT
jgi:hypothetical protein